MFKRRGAFMGVGAAAVSAAALAACGNGTSGIPSNLQAIITAIQQGAAKACGFLPSVEGVLALVGGLNPVIAGVEAAVAAICAALPPAASLAPRLGVPTQVTVKGVVIGGMFVR